MVVREGTEGPYVGNGGALRVDTPHEIATEVSVNTRHGVERVVRYAFNVAAGRPRKHLTLVHKHNVLVHAGHLWRRTVEAVAPEFPDVTWDYLHVDAATIKMATDPASFDVIVTDNLFGDILTDEAAAISGGIGLAASGNVNPDKTGALDVRARPRLGARHCRPEKADPSATVLSVAMMLDFLGYPEIAKRVEDAVAADAASKGDAPRTTVAGGRRYRRTDQGLVPTAWSCRSQYRSERSSTQLRQGGSHDGEITACRTGTDRTLGPSALSRTPRRCRKPTGRPRSRTSSSAPSSLTTWPA